MSFGYDPELPAGYQDADIEMAELTDLGTQIAALNRRGVCTHESFRSQPGEKATCTYGCQRTFATAEHLMADRARHLG